MHDRRFRFVVLGLGSAASSLHIPALRRLDDVEIVAAADPEPDRRRLHGGLATFADPGDALSVPADAVLIATPPATHESLAVRALGLDRHVYLEKPLACGLAGAAVVAEAAASSGRSLQVGYAYRFHPLWQRLTRMVRAGRLQLPFAATSVFDASRHQRHRAGWNHPCIDLGLHHVDLLSELTRENPVGVEVRHDRRLTATWSDGSVLDGEYGEGPGRDHMTIQFAATTVRLDRRRGLRLRGAGVRGAIPSPTLLRARPGSTGWDRSFERALANFVSCARAGTQPSPGPVEGRQAVAVGAAIERSLVTGGPAEVAHA